ncbi:MAG: helix-turn-helix domain-containing protein [Bacteroides sp.]|nr:helix-turn-helix domain-containing protein [Bacteroides sp.]
MDTKEIIGKNIAEFRKRLKYSQEDISKYLGISQPAYAKYEKGETMIPMESIEKIAELYNVAEYDFMEENKELFQTSLACAFRKEGSIADLAPIAEFQKIIRNYIMMCDELD